jgi:hypothetical protein
MLWLRRALWFCAVLITLGLVCSIILSAYLLIASSGLPSGEMGDAFLALGLIASAVSGAWLGLTWWVLHHRQSNRTAHLCLLAAAAFISPPLAIFVRTFLGI